MDPLLQQTLQNYAKQGNSFGKSARMRARWTKALDFTIPDARKEPVEYVWFVGDFASFDERVQQRVADGRADPARRRRVVRTALRRRAQRRQRRAPDRRGGPVRDAGRAQHGRACGEAQFEAIFTTDPHSLNTLRNEYPQFGLDKPVYHYTELLAELVGQGRDLAAHAADRDPRHLPRPLLPGALQPDHRGAAQADRGDRRRARGDAAPRDEHVLLRRRRRADLDGRRRRRGRAAERAADPRGADARRASTTSSSAAPRTWRCTPTRPRSSAPSSRSRS